MIYAIGDVHGVLSELRRVLDLIETDAAGRGIARPKVVFLGDYVDRRGQSSDVLNVLTGDKMARLDPVFIKGNHDDAMLDVIERPGFEFAWWMMGGDATVRSYLNDDLRLRAREGRGSMMNMVADFRTAVPTPHVTFLQGLRQAHKAGPWLFAHAGLNPHYPVDHQPLNGFIVGDEDFLNWPEPIDGLCIVHGHWTERGGPVIRRHRVGVDTGCGFPGGHLSAVVLNPDCQDVVDILG